MQKAEIHNSGSQVVPPLLSLCCHQQQQVLQHLLLKLLPLKRSCRGHRQMLRMQQKQKRALSMKKPQQVLLTASGLDSYSVQPSAGVQQIRKLKKTQENTELICKIVRQYIGCHTGPSVQQAVRGKAEVYVHSDCTAIGSLSTRGLHIFKQRPVSGSIAHTCGKEVT